ncbi:MAG: hypothetical protein K0R57_2380 [Paenibacillaceae bacterium]|jgi:hypothetical protein|nr:hypothetical protein [Paenibacillaceae bacterium]
MDFVDSGFAGGMSWFFILFNGMFFLVFPFTIGLMIFLVIRRSRTFSRNKAQPVLSVEAKVVSKRSDIARRARSHVNDFHYTGTTYYAAFEVESGDRMELELPGDEYGLLVEGDFGKLTFQGTWFKSFDRSR